MVLCKGFRDAVLTRLKAPLSRMEDIWKKFPPVMRHFFHERFREPAAWFERRLAYTRSVAVNSMAGAPADARPCSPWVAHSPATHRAALGASNAHQRQVNMLQHYALVLIRTATVRPRRNATADLPTNLAHDSEVLLRQAM